MYLSIIGILALLLNYATPADQQMQALAEAYVAQIEPLSLPPLTLSYETNLSNIGSNLTEQEAFFNSFQNQLQKINRADLSIEEQINFDLLTYELNINLERIELEQAWQALQVDSISDQGLAYVPMGKDWYAYFLKRWVNDQVTPEQIFELGLQEIERVNGEIRKIQQASGMDSLAFWAYLEEEHFYSNEADRLQAKFEAARAIIEQQYTQNFPFSDRVPQVNIARGTNIRLKIAPAYYANQTFYFNLFDYPFNQRQIDIFLIHEGVPGHHYQRMVDNSLDLPPIRTSNVYYGYIEGWAAYVEELGHSIGLYRTPYDYLGKWEWDIVRSTRLCLDVGLNYYGWTDEEALAFWKKHITAQDEIAMREIDRMKRWPAQVVTYKYGAAQILKWREQAMAQGDFDEKAFHQSVLEHGALPFWVLEKYI